MPDLSRPVDWRPLLADVDAVVHLAGIAHVSRDIPDAQYDRINRLATKELALQASLDAEYPAARLRVVDPRADRPVVPRHVLTERRSAEPDRRLWPLQARRREPSCADMACRSRSCGRW